MKAISRREFLKTCTLATTLSPVALYSMKPLPLKGNWVLIDNFKRPDELYHGDGWESLNPGYWKIKNQALRRRLKNVGDQARATGYPFHWETKAGRPMPVNYDPSLPFGMIWRRDWYLKGNYTIRIEATYRGKNFPQGNPAWLQNQKEYGMMGICFGADSLHESWYGRDKWIGYGERLFNEFKQWNGDKGDGDAAWMAAWKGNGVFGIYDHATDHPDTAKPGAERFTGDLQYGERVKLTVSVEGADKKMAAVTSTITMNSETKNVTCTKVDRDKFTNGYFGIVGRGLLDWEVNRVLLDPENNTPLNAPVNACHTCYALGETLKQVKGEWQCKFVAVFRHNGNKAEIRISSESNPAGGWGKVPVAGTASIVSNNFRLNTAIITATLPGNPADRTWYYTIWQDGKNVTGDPRIGSASVGAGTGMVGNAPANGNYVGRLPQLKAPYRVCGQGGHMIGGKYPATNLKNTDWFQENWIRDHAMPEAYQSLEDYNFQIMLWEDDVWYLELILFPPSTDDAYKTIMTTIAGSTSRWQMMRHWNVINPGDHDYGMDDSKGPEQYVIRRYEGLGQDPEYMRRNFQIVHHLSRGLEQPSGTENPRRWARWQMPNRDFSLLIVDARLWRTSQDTDIWDDWGWGHKQNLLGRENPTRTLLGEEQFAWLTEMIRTDPAPLICITGLNALHTIWGPNPSRNQRHRGLADYAGWVKAGADRVLDLLGSRSGITSIFGDIHCASITYDLTQRVYECSFGPISSGGGRGPKPGFGPRMTDHDGRSLKVHAFYHHRWESPSFEPQSRKLHFNFLETEFDPQGSNPKIRLQIRHLADAPGDAPRGGKKIEARASETGRIPTCDLPELWTIPNAVVHLMTLDGRPIRGIRSLNDGQVPLTGLADVESETPLMMIGFDGEKTDYRIIKTLAL